MTNLHMHIDNEDLSLVEKFGIYYYIETDEIHLSNL